jgi:hypothetical protein
MAVPAISAGLLSPGVQANSAAEFKNAFFN